MDYSGLSVSSDTLLLAVPLSFVAASNVCASGKALAPRPRYPGRPGAGNWRSETVCLFCAKQCRRCCEERSDESDGRSIGARERRLLGRVRRLGRYEMDAGRKVQLEGFVWIDLPRSPRHARYGSRDSHTHGFARATVNLVVGQCARVHVVPVPESNLCPEQRGSTAAARIRRELQRRGGDWSSRSQSRADARSSYRWNLVPILRAHRTSQLEARLAAGGRWKDHGFVFTSRYGEPLDGPRLNRQTKKLLRQTWSGGLTDCKHLQVGNRQCADCQAEHLPVLHFHSLRHSCASFLLAQGVPARSSWKCSDTRIFGSRSTPTRTSARNSKRRPPGR